MKKGKIAHVFPGSNTPKGFHSFYRQGLKDMERVFVLKGGPGTGKSTLMRKIAYNMSERGYDIELWQCSSDNDSIDGVIIQDLGIAVVDGTSPHVVDPVYPGAVDQIVNLGDHWDQTLLRDNKAEIKTLTHAISAAFGRAYEKLAAGKAAYDQLCQETKQGLAAEEIADICANLEQEIFYGDLVKVRHFFAAAITPLGWVGYNQEISSNCAKRFILQGGASNNVHLALSKIADAAIERGHNIDLYHSSMDPEHLEMLVLPDLDVALVDSEGAGLEPCFDDVLIELLPKNNLTGLEAGSESLKAEELRRQWQELFAAANQEIAQAKSLHNKLEAYYVQAMDFEGIDKVTKGVFSEIWSMAATKEKIEASK